MKSRAIRMAVASFFLLMAGTLSVWAQAPAAMSVNTQPTRAQATELAANAKTAQDHLELAAFYRNEAKEAEMMAETHDQMANGYKVNPTTGNTTQLQRHCMEFASMARKAAEDDNEMAKEHEDIAAKLQQESMK